MGKKARFFDLEDSKELQDDMQGYGRGMFYFGLIVILLGIISMFFLK